MQDLRGGARWSTFFLLPLSQPYPGAASVLVDELYACGFQRRPNLLRSAFATAELANHRFKPSNSWL
jgi:hypothetical protein